MRAILIDWLVEVHLKFKLLPETLYLTVNLIDRFLSLQQINRNKLQLVGVTCLLIACKYEEIYPPIVMDVVYITDNAYNASEILEMEQAVLTTLDFDMHITSPYRFFERFCYLVKPNKNEELFAQYMMEGSLTQYSMIKYSPAVLAGSAIYFAGKMCRNKNIWSK
jgi:G2/mitotic-specific cyclin-B, other